MIHKNHIAIAGAGLVGTLLAIGFAKRGYKVHIYEYRDDPRKTNLKEGRSINLTMGERGWEALRNQGISDRIKEIATPLYQRMMHHVDGKNTTQPYGAKGQAIYSLSRYELNCRLLDIADEFSNINTVFHKRCVDVDLEYSTLYFLDNITGRTNGVEADLIIGADGAYSAVRREMMRSPMFNYSQNYINYGYKELTIEADKNGNHVFDNNSFHLWARDSYVMVASPDIKGTFTGTLFMPFKGENSFEKLDSPKNIESFFEKQFPDLKPHIKDLSAKLLNRSPYPMVTVKCNPWTYQDKFLLIGDAAHAITPFYGQGMNSGFEDCNVLMDLVDEHGTDWTTILPKFEKLRMPHTDALSHLTDQNFREISSHVNDEKFLLKKKIEVLLYEKFPEKWKPIYPMVAFSNIPYAEALEIGNKQKSIMNKIMALDDIELNWEQLDYENMIDFENLEWKLKEVNV